MKIKNLLIVCVVLMVAFAIVSCGGKDSPKSLAKEYFDLSMQFDNDPDNSDEILARMNEILVKIPNMSVTNQLAFASELAKISEEALKSNDLDMFEDFSDDFDALELQDALRAVTDELQEAMDSLGTDLQDALNSIGTDVNEAVGGALRRIGL